MLNLLKKQKHSKPNIYLFCLVFMYMCIWVCAYSCVVKCVCVCMHIPVCESGYMHVIVCVQRSENSIRYQFSPCTFLRQDLCCSQTSPPVGVHDVLPQGPSCSLLHTGSACGCPGYPCPFLFISLGKTEITGIGYHIWILLGSWRIAFRSSHLDNTHFIHWAIFPALMWMSSK